MAKLLKLFPELLNNEDGKQKIRRDNYNFGGGKYENVCCWLSDQRWELSWRCDKLLSQFSSYKSHRIPDELYASRLFEHLPPTKNCSFEALLSPGERRIVRRIGIYESLRIQRLNVTKVISSALDLIKSCHSPLMRSTR